MIEFVAVVLGSVVAWLACLLKKAHRDIDAANERTALAKKFMLQDSAAWQKLTADMHEAKEEAAKAWQAYNAEVTKNECLAIRGGQVEAELARLKESFREGAD